MRLALVYDRVNKWGGAERVLLALNEIWPEAPLFTAVYDETKAAWAKVFKVHPSFLQHFPLASAHHELYPWITPLAFETFLFDDYDVVISVTSAEAKNIITKPSTLHICYSLTPTRYLWSGYENYMENPGLGRWEGLGKLALKHMAPTLKNWDIIAAGRPDYYLAISNHVSERIKKYYKRDVEAVVYPPADIKQFTVHSSQFTEKQKNYFLVVSRLVGYKRIDIIIEAFNKFGWPLIIIGDGLAKDSLVHLANKNITFISSYLTDSELGEYYENCRALIIAADEDFGLSAVEAQAYGKPVVAFADSGVAEIVIDGQTGVLFQEQASVSLINALKRLENMKITSQACQKRAEFFSKEKFKKEMKTKIENLAKKYFI